MICLFFVFLLYWTKLLITLLWRELRVSGSGDFLISKVSCRGPIDHSLANYRAAKRTNQRWGRISWSHESESCICGDQSANEREEEVWFIARLMRWNRFETLNAKSRNSKTRSEINECTCPVPFLSLEQWLGRDCRSIVDFPMLQWTATKHACSRMLSVSTGKKQFHMFFS